MSPPNAPAILARFDPLTLKPVSRRVLVGEYHDAWSVSPDGSHIALGISAPGGRVGGGRIGIRIADLDAMKVVREVETGIAAVALAWLAPRRLVASLQRGGTVLVDPQTGEILHRWGRFSFPEASARTRSALVMLFSGSDGSAVRSAAAHLVVVDARGHLRTVALERVQLAGGLEDASGLAVDSARGRAYVFAADAPVAAVDLRTMSVSYHLELEGPDVEEDDVVRARQRRAAWIGNGLVAVFGRDLMTRAGRVAAVPAGVTLIDTATWSACILDPKASGAASVADRLLVYGPRLPVSREEPGVGLRAYAVGGGESFHLFDDAKVLDVEVAAGRAYVRTPDALHVVDVRSGKIVSAIVPPPEFLDLIVRRS